MITVASQMENNDNNNKRHYIFICLIVLQKVSFVLDSKINCALLFSRVQINRLPFPSLSNTERKKKKAERLCE